MEKEFLVIMLFMMSISLTTRVKARSKPERLQVVDSVDIEKYSGLWYEIARLPNPFQKKCAGNVTAFYEIRKDGRLNVINSCVEDSDTAWVKGIARVVDSATNANLEVSFVSLLRWNLFWGDYWIIGLGESYEYAVVGDPNRKYGWILARDKQLPENTMEKIFALLEKKGYDPDRFMMTNQE